MGLSDKELVAHVEDLLERGPLRVFDQVFYHGTLYGVAGDDIGRILSFDHDREYVRVEFPHGTFFCWIRNITRVPKKE